MTDDGTSSTNPQTNGGSPSVTGSPANAPIARELNKKFWRAQLLYLSWRTFDIVLLVAGVAGPIAASSIGAKSAWDDKPVFTNHDPKIPPGREEIASWNLTVRFIATIAMMGALAIGVHKALKIEQCVRKAAKCKAQLEHIRSRLLHPSPNLEGTHTDYRAWLNSVIRDLNEYDRTSKNEATET